MNREELANLGLMYSINPAFFRHYGHLFTQEGLAFISRLDGDDLTELINFIIEAEEKEMKK